jgi:hypothetical protein
MHLNIWGILIQHTSLWNILTTTYMYLWGMEPSDDITTIVIFMLFIGLQAQGSRLNFRICVGYS